MIRTNESRGEEERENDMSRTNRKGITEKREKE